MRSGVLLGSLYRVNMQWRFSVSMFCNGSLRPCIKSNPLERYVVLTTTYGTVLRTRGPLSCIQQDCAESIWHRPPWQIVHWTWTRVEEILQESVYKCLWLLRIYVVTIDEERHSVDVICTLQNKQLLAILIPAVAISEVYIPACTE